MSGIVAQCIALEREIKSNSQNLSIFHPTLRQLRGNFQIACHRALISDYTGSQKVNLEALLWKHAFYNPISDFRKRLSNAHGDLTIKTRDAFLKFVEEASTYYIQLSQAFQNFPVITSPVRASLARCYICIGDLHRYAVAATSESETTTTVPKSSTPHEDPEPQTRDYTQSRYYYSKAIHIHPEGGNAYNQLAVLSCFEDNDFAAVYYYLRAYYAPVSFTVAKENASMLLQQYIKNMPSPSASHPIKLNSNKKQASSRVWSHHRGSLKESMPFSVLEQSLADHYLSIIASLFNNINLDMIIHDIQKASVNMEDYLNRLKHQASSGINKETRNNYIIENGDGDDGDDVDDNEEQRIGIISRPPQFLLMLIATLLMIVHGKEKKHIDSEPIPPPTSTMVAPATAAAVVKGYAVHALLDTTSRIAHSASKLPFRNAKRSSCTAALASPIFSPLRSVLYYLTQCSTIRHVSIGGYPALPGSNTEINIHKLSSSRISFWNSLTLLAPEIYQSISILDGKQEEEGYTNNNTRISTMKKKIDEDALLLCQPETIYFQSFAPFLSTAKHLSSNKDGNNKNTAPNLDTNINDSNNNGDNPSDKGTKNMHRIDIQNTTTKQSRGVSKEKKKYHHPSLTCAYSLRVHMQRLATCAATWINTTTSPTTTMPLPLQEEADYGATFLNALKAYIACIDELNTPSPLSRELDYTSMKNGISTRGGHSTFGQMESAWIKSTSPTPPRDTGIDNMEIEKKRDEDDADDEEEIVFAPQRSNNPNRRIGSAVPILAPPRDMMPPQRQPQRVPASSLMSMDDKNKIERPLSSCMKGNDIDDDGDLILQDIAAHVLQQTHSQEKTDVPHVYNEHAFSGVQNAVDVFHGLIPHQVNALVAAGSAGGTQGVHYHHNIEYQNHHHRGHGQEQQQQNMYGGASLFAPPQLGGGYFNDDGDDETINDMIGGDEQKQQPAQGLRSLLFGKRIG